jgi:hypothetical protein
MAFYELSWARRVAWSILVALGHAFLFTEKKALVEINQKFSKAKRYGKIAIDSGSNPGGPILFY